LAPVSASTLLNSHQQNRRIIFKKRYHLKKSPSLEESQVIVSCSSPVLIHFRLFKALLTVDEQLQRRRMAGFSFTAPIVSEEEERLERQCLTDKERLDVWNDLHGRPCRQTIVESDVHLSKRELELKHELSDIPGEQKEAFLQAVSTCPHLVQSESPSLMFLRREHFDPKLAAQRLVKYWECRRVIFGKEAFLPMTLEKGALSPVEVEVLESKQVALLPKDSAGRMVLYESRSSCGPSSPLSKVCYSLGSNGMVDQVRFRFVFSRPSSYSSAHCGIFCTRRWEMKHV
jgi:hypothetical protein